MDKQEIEIQLSELKLQYLKGSGNKCPKCKRKGNFGSIVSYECESGNRYLLCGWCGAITEIKQRKVKRWDTMFGGTNFTSTVKQNNETITLEI